MGQVDALHYRFGFGVGETGLYWATLVEAWQTMGVANHGRSN